MSIYTIGYEGLDMNGFLALLRKGNVETVVDIRELPLSRKAGFSKNGLHETLNLHGFEYMHVPELGCPKPIRDQYRTDGDWGRYKEEFLQFLTLQNDVIAEMAAMATTTTCALLCFEADYNYCHRSMVAAAMSRVVDLSVRHLQAGMLKTASAGLSQLELV
ncbi:MAG TPA: DUF488 domain-containing protein [Noviherbaspirillum sp.]|uniref:DUF488 domain-containing protein n=1 Tax=Noviherbaspirillum sp. TaxID=1926288 RepID=UPI002B4A8F60|nr:DUF488 domain-containing protein [Noviherbaspirillum sp.]HJV85212.1 DUF488 domain-containing protein [Noviherbaspirillum sp.]